MTSAASGARPTALFMFGISQRSGTHYLHDLLMLHPECASFARDLPEWASRPEDWLWAYADGFESYLERVGRHWRPEWDFPAASDDLLRSLGAALERSVVQWWVRSAGDVTSPPRYVVTKTPSTRGLPLLLRALPGHPAVVIVRDGRDVVESGHRTWHYSYERWMRIWQQGADDLLAAQQADGRDALLTVRYEDIMRDLDGTLRPLLTALDLDPDRYDWAAAEALPVSGSSTFRPDHGRVTWEPVTADRQQLQAPRWEAWPPRLRSRFAHVAGAQMRALGYELEDTAGAARSAWDAARDGTWSALRRARVLRDAFVAGRRTN